MARYRDMYERLTAHVTLPEHQEESTACWEHDGPLSRPDYGYPKVTVRENGKQTTRYAHRLMYTAVHGDVPEGHEVDHNCHNHRCINPDHLQALPVPKNRGKMPWHTYAKAAAFVGAHALGLLVVYLDVFVWRPA